MISRWVAPTNSASSSHAERLSTNRLPNYYVRDHDELWVDGIASSRIWTTQSRVRCEGITLTQTRNYVRLMKLENQLGKQVGLLPPLLVYLPDEIVVRVRHSLDLAGEYIKHFHISFWPTQEPEAELAHERRRYAAGDDPSPGRKPVAELLRGDVLNQQVVPS